MKGEGQLSYMKSRLRAELPKEMVAGANRRDTGSGDGGPGLHSDTHPRNPQGCCPAHSDSGRRSRSSLFRHVLDGLVLLHGSLPVTAIEFLSDHTPDSAFIKAVGGNS